MGKRVFPTEFNVGLADNLESQLWRENFGTYPGYAGFFERIPKSGLSTFVSSGMALGAVGGQLHVTIAAGVAIVNGLMVELTTTQTLTGLQANQMNYIYVGYTIDGNKLATAVSITSNITGSVPAQTVMVGRALTNASQATAVENSTANPGLNSGSYVGDGQIDKTIFLGWLPSRVTVSGFFQTGDTVDSIAVSAVPGSTFGWWVRSGVITVSSNNYDRPGLAGIGFIVSQNGGNGTNRSGITFRYLAEV